MAMSFYQQEQLLNAVMHYITPDIRRKVMSEVPQAYNAYCGRLIVFTVDKEGEAI